MEFADSNRENRCASRVGASIQPRHDDSMIKEKMTAVLAEK
jgi:hypothetical protein